MRAVRPLCPLPTQCPAHPSPSRPTQSTPSSHPSSTPFCAFTVAVPSPSYFHSTTPWLSLTSYKPRTSLGFWSSGSRSNILLKWGSYLTYPIHTTCTLDFRGSAWVRWSPEPQASSQQAGCPTEWPAGATRVHALRPRDRVSTQSAPRQLHFCFPRPWVEACPRICQSPVPLSPTTGEPLSRRGTSSTTLSASCAVTVA